MGRDWEEVAAEIAAKRIEDREARVCSLLGVAEDCANLPTDPLTPRKMLLLEYASNAFMVGGEVKPADVVQFLWIVSPSYQANSAAATAFAKKVGKLQFAKATISIKEWVELQLIDIPAGRPGGKISGRVWLAQYVDLFASEYGWTDEKILDTPIQRLGQFKNEILARVNGDNSEPCSVREDRLKAEWLKEQQCG